MPFAKSPLPASSGGLVASYPAMGLVTKHTVKLAVNDPIRIKLTHSHNAVVKLAVDYLESPYPPFEIQCAPQYRVYMQTDAT